ncbi:hypothetical protein Pla52n_67230 [Stieleria varia]|uniref:Uncharacterized protein n=1 Tax=Stieleria varia TaxID=2528005 RepID=A0A5C5ZQV1_9BACT|nr:hypothetical protein Pla52n_67230 [Stieleria varia]
MGTGYTTVEDSFREFCLASSVISVTMITRKVRQFAALIPFIWPAPSFQRI